MAHAETALPVAERLTGERGRTVKQLRMFAELAREGSWVDARIDRAIPERKPLPRPDIRRMLIPIGPVAVFGASNFPLAFSVAGGDTASALAAGCPVVVKGASGASGYVGARGAGDHPGHRRRRECPPGVFSLLQSTRNDIAVALVRHPLTKAVAFTGSPTSRTRAVRRRRELGRNRFPCMPRWAASTRCSCFRARSRERADAIAAGLAQSVTLGVGQFCTCPGIAAGIAGADFDRFVARLEELIANAGPGTMLYPQDPATRTRRARGS